MTDNLADALRVCIEVMENVGGENCCKRGIDAAEQALAAHESAKAATPDARLMAQSDYSIDLQRIIESLCNNREIVKPATGAMYHYDMAVKYQAAIRQGVTLPREVVDALEWYAADKSPYGNNARWALEKIALLDQNARGG